MEDKWHGEIRKARLDDAKRLLEIYAPYVTDTAITFEREVPSIEEFENRIREITAFYPYITAVENGKIIGYAYAARFHKRTAYDRSVEMTVYVEKGLGKRGVGSALYRELERILILQNITNAYACIVYPHPASIGFHESFGYKIVAHYTKCGYKLGKWWDVVWMEKLLAEHKNPPPDVICAKDI